MIRAFATIAALGLAASATAQTVLIENATVHTLGEAGTVNNANVLIRDGRVAEVGAGATPVRGGKVIDAAGRIVTPGIFDPLSALGLVEVSLIAGTADDAVEDPEINAAFDVAPAINPRSTLIPITRIEGVTRALVAPSSPSAWLSTPPGHVIAGQGAVINLGKPDTAIDKARVAMFVTLGEHGADFGGGSRAGSVAVLRAALEEARAWKAMPPAFKTGNPGHYSINRPAREALAPVLDATLPVVARVHRASDIRAVLALAEEFGLRLIIAGGDEAWMLADALANAEVPVILDPTSNLPANFERLAARSDAAAILHSAGVLIAFSDEDSHNARNLKQLAGNAVAHGLPWDAALAAITRNPAEIYGMADTLGALMPGHAGDAVVWSGDPLEVTSFADAVVIAGEVIPMRSRQTLLRDRYLGESDWPRAYR